MMLDQLRDTVLRPVVEVLLLIPLPWRSCVDVFFILLIIYLLPPGLWLSPFIWLLRQLMALGLGISLWMQRLIANRRQSKLIDTIDGLSEILIRGFGSAHAFLKSRLSGLRKWGRPRKFWMVLLSLLPAALWFGRPYLGNITVGRAIDTGFARLIVAEQWALSGKWVLPEMGHDENQPVVGASEESPGGSQVQQPQTFGSEPIHVVKKGETLKGIAHQYGIQMQCVIAVNQPRFNSFNPDSLVVGMDLIIPIGDSNCREW